MNCRFMESETEVDLDSARSLLEATPQWIDVRRGEDDRTLRPAPDCARFLEDHEANTIQLMEIPG